MPNAAHAPPSIYSISRIRHESPRKANGRAYGTFGDAKVTREQKGFLARATAELAQNGLVVPVRLALVAEMVKSRPWTTATLDEVGGMDGVGAKFLDDSFTSGRSNPVHRYHAAAAKAVLESLLPETSADLKGRRRTITDLQHVSGYGARPGDFAELVQVLDRNLRLITPVDQEHSLDDAAARPPAERCYQLTHDYLVHSIRDWLNKDRRGTLRGRAQLLLAERTGLWNVKPESRYLPSLREWLSIRLLVASKRWTPEQRRMMKRAGRMHGMRLMALGGLIGLVAAGVIAYNAYSVTQNLLDSLANTNVDKIPNVLSQLDRYPRWVYSGRLHSLGNRAGNDARSQLGYSLALSFDYKQRELLYKHVLVADPVEAALIRDRGSPGSSRKPGSFGATSSRPRRRARASFRWPRSLLGMTRTARALERRCRSGRGRAGQMQSSTDAKAWREALLPARSVLLEPLGTIFRDNERPEVEQTLAMEHLSHYASDRPSVLVDLLLDASLDLFSETSSTLIPVLQRDSPTVIEELRKAIGSGPRLEPGAPPRVEREWRTAMQIRVDAMELAKDQHAGRSRTRRCYAHAVWQRGRRVEFADISRGSAGAERVAPGDQHRRGRPGRAGE